MNIFGNTSWSNICEQTAGKGGGKIRSERIGEDLLCTSANKIFFLLILSIHTNKHILLNRSQCTKYSGFSIGFAYWLQILASGFAAMASLCSAGLLRRNSQNTG
jgi:hypothetical protein